MSVWQYAFSMITRNPLTSSPYDTESEIGYSGPIPPQGNLMTEGGVFILIENGDFLDTE